MKQKAKIEKQVLSPADAAVYLNVSTKTLERWRRPSSNFGPKWVQQGRRIGYRITDLNHYLEDITQTPGDDFAA